MLNGMGCPYMDCPPRGATLKGLGVDWGTLIPEITSGTAQIIYAGKGIPYNPQQPYGMSPYGSMYQGGQMYAEAPGAYLTGGGQNLWVWIALGVGAMLLLSRSRR
jgi:hypothetical protein